LEYRSTAALAVGVTVFFHLLLFVNILTFFTGLRLPVKSFSEDYFTNKVYLMPFAMAYGYFFIVYYSHKRAMAIVTKYPKDYKVITFKNFLTVLLIMIVPLIISFQLIKHNNQTLFKRSFSEETCTKNVQR
jgi:hypothetical protein